MAELPSKTAVTVSELNAYIKSKLEGDFLLSHVYLRGEISNFKTYPSGHCYFTLKDKDSMVSAVMWASSAAKLSFRPKDGDEVVCLGRVSVYPPRGSYQFNADSMEIFGLGAELIRLEKLKAKLAAEGLFDPARKRPLVRFPKKVGVIAGKDSAGLRDVVFNLGNRWPLCELVVFPSLVQGKEAPKDLIVAFNKAQEADLDTLIIARGGGSSEDLMAFNDEALVRALATSNCPIISAVGHEVDTTLCDLVADKRVSTPTAAAVAAVPDKNEIRQGLDEALMRLQNGLMALLGRKKREVEHLSSRPFWKRPEALYEAKLESLGVLRKRLDYAMSQSLQSKRLDLQRLTQTLNALSPLNVLKRGYAIISDESGKPVRSIEAVHTGDRLRTRVKDGIIDSEVIAAKKGDPQ